METTYQTGYWEMEYIIYDKPIRMKKTDVLREYTEGGAFLYLCEEDSEELDILAHIKYMEGWPRLRYHRAIKLEPAFLQLSSWHLEVFHPIQKSDINIENPKIMSADKFYGSESKKIKYIAEMCEKFFDVKNEDMKLYLRSDKENDGVIYYGYCFEYLSEAEQQKMGKGATYMFYPGYCVECEKREEAKNQEIELENIKRENVKREKDQFDSAIEKAIQEIKKLPKIAYQIRTWIMETPFNDFCKEITRRVKGQEATEIVVANIYNYLKCVAYGKPHNNNMFLAAPSGCGKTETYRAISKYFEHAIPELVIYQVDMTSMTQEGFKGKNSEYMTEPLKADDNGIGIAFLDEFDKKIVPSYSGNGDNVNMAVQTQILTIIEGRKEGGRKKIDTGNTLFIAMGAFDACRQKKSIREKHVGFGQMSYEGEKHYTYITREDMIDLGACYELIGRFSSIINYHELSEETIDEIIDEMVKKVSRGFECKVSISANMRNALHYNANSKYGCRILESMIRENAMQEYLKLLKSDVAVDEYEILIVDVGQTISFPVKSGIVSPKEGEALQAVS